jgi:hypothetical protein
MTARPRTLIGKYASLAGREAIYETPDGFDVESREGYDVVERRVLFDDVLLVTLHRHYGTAYLLTTGLISLFFLTVAMTVWFTMGPGAVTPTIIGAMGLPSLISFLLRAIFGVDTLTIFGRRSKASVGFRLRKGRARAAYERVCMLVRNAQERVASVPPEDRPDDVPGVAPF